MLADRPCSDAWHARGVQAQLSSAAWCSWGWCKLRGQAAAACLLCRRPACALVWLSEAHAL